VCSNIIACGGASLFIEETLGYIILEATSNDSFQALWIDIRFLKKKVVICRILYRQHNSTENFLTEYIEEATEGIRAAGKNLRLLGDCNLCLQRIETCHYSHEFLFASQSCYHIPTINKPKPVHRASISLINNIFVNNPDQVLVNGNLITDVSDHVLLFAVLYRGIDKT